MSILEEKQRSLEQLSLMTLESEMKAQRAQQGKTVAYILKRNEDVYAKVEAQEQAMENLVEAMEETNAMIEKLLQNNTQARQGVTS